MNNPIFLIVLLFTQGKRTHIPSIFFNMYSPSKNDVIKAVIVPYLINKTLLLSLYIQKKLI